jgi:hypothetical protein
MKFNRRHVLLLSATILLIIALQKVYYQYGWIWNPWEGPRIVWDEPNPALIGQTFSITRPASFVALESVTSELKEQKIGYLLMLNRGQPMNNLEGEYKPVKSDEVFTIKKTYWVRLNAWSQSFRSQSKVAIVGDDNGRTYLFTFLDFAGTNRPELFRIQSAELNASPWDFRYAETPDN